MMSKTTNCLFGASVCLSFGLFFMLTNEITAAAGWGSGVAWALVSSKYAYDVENK